MSPIYDMDAVNNAPDEYRRKPGVYRVKVDAVDDRPSKAGKKMLNLTLVDFDTGKTVCFDRLMLEGKEFALTLTKNKLKTLGVSTSGPLDTRDIKGRAAWIAVVYGEPNDRGRSYLQVDIGAPGSKFGYWPDSPECPIAIDESQAVNLFGEREQVDVDPTTLPVDHPDYRPF